MAPTLPSANIVLAFFAILTPSLAAPPPSVPAETAVPSSKTAAGAPLFHSETLQLTDGVLNKLNLRNSASLFAFGGNSSSSNLSLSDSGACKVFPGDSEWPSTSTWSLFDRLLGGALIETVPLASSCYSSWPEYDSDQCKVVSNNWTDSNLQCVLV